MTRRREDSDDDDTSSASSVVAEVITTVAETEAKDNKENEDPVVAHELPLPSIKPDQVAESTEAPNLASLMEDTARYWEENQGKLNEEHTASMKKITGFMLKMYQVLIQY